MSKVVKKDPLVPVFKQLGADVGEILTLLRNKSNVGETSSATECPAPTVVEREVEVIKYVDRPVEKIVEKVVHVPTGSAPFKHYNVTLSDTEISGYTLPIPAEFNRKLGLIFVKKAEEWALVYKGTILSDGGPRIDGNQPCEAIVIETDGAVESIAATALELR